MVCQVAGLMGHGMALAPPNRAPTTKSGRWTTCTPPSGRCCCMQRNTCALDADSMRITARCKLLRCCMADSLNHSTQVPPHCIPIHANVTSYDWRRLADTIQFDVIMMDPPWSLATANPTRGAVFSMVMC